MVRQRVRIRFRKIGDLRLIGHRDLLRTMERLFRRAGLSLRMSEGYHPKPRMTFPSPLPVGVSGTDEVMEVELDEPRTADDFLAAVRPVSPPGLDIERAEVLPPGGKKARVASATYEMPLPETHRAGVAERIAGLLDSASVPVDRGDGKPPLELHDFLEELALEDGCLRMRLRVAQQRLVRPRDVLELLGLGDLEGRDTYLTRTRVELE